MDVLIIGGTQFVGRHLTEAALDAGHNVTLFNRGKTNPDVYPQVERLTGNRDGDLEALRGRKWDVVFDPSGYVPRVVRQSAELLKDAVGRYVFVSSISVYVDTKQSAENDPVHELEDPNTEEVGRFYGALKVACERTVTELYGDRALNVRPGFIVGRYDPIYRLPFLLHRYERGGERLAGRAEQPVQIIHARDLADWMFRAVDQKLSGDYNLTGTPVSMRELLNTVVEVTGKPTTITYTSDAFLQEHELAPVDGLTYWVPQEMDHFMQVTVQKAIDTGFTQQPLRAIIGDTLSWIRENHLTPENFRSMNPENVFSEEREQELLAKWHEKAAQSV
jgi:2'-hydroxyisoflavone reductase